MFHSIVHIPDTLTFTSFMNFVASFLDLYSSDIGGQVFLKGKLWVKVDGDWVLVVIHFVIGSWKVGSQFCFRLEK